MVSQLLLEFRDPRPGLARSFAVALRSWADGPRCGDWKWRRNPLELLIFTLENGVAFAAAFPVVRLDCRASRARKWRRIPLELLDSRPEIASSLAVRPPALAGPA